MKRSHFLSILIGIVLLGILAKFSPSLAAELSDAALIAKRATVGVLRHTEDPAAQSSFSRFAVRGSGIHIGDGYILTARHAVDRQEGGKTVIPKTVRIITSELHELPATFVGANNFLDISLYKIQLSPEDSILGTAQFAQAEPLPSHEVFTVGYPLGWGPAFSFGRVGNPNTFLQTIQSRLYQIDLSACSGNSGGGLFNHAGEIVGIVHAIIQTEITQGERRCSRFAFAVPGILVHKIVKGLIAGESIRFSKLGIQLTSVNRNQQWLVAVRKATGPSRQAGFKKGDVLLSIDRHPIHSAAGLKTYLIEHTVPGQQVAIRILRGNKERTLQVRLGES